MRDPDDSTHPATSAPHLRASLPETLHPRWRAVACPATWRVLEASPVRGEQPALSGQKAPARAGRGGPGHPLRGLAAPSPASLLLGPAAPRGRERVTTGPQPP